MAREARMIVMRLKHVHKIRSKGKVYYYHRPTGSRLKSEPGTPEFIQELQALNEGIEGRRERPGTLGALFQAYLASPEYSGLSERSKKDYEAVIYGLEKIFDMPLTSIDTPFIFKLRDKKAMLKKRRNANYTVQVLRLVFNWGRPRGFIQENPAADVPLIRKPRSEADVNRAWTCKELETVLEFMPFEIRTAVALGAYVGLRQGDALRLPWSAYDGTSISVRQSKTGHFIKVPVHSALKEILDEANIKKKSPIIVVGKMGKPFTSNSFRALFFKKLRELREKKLIDGGLTFHGLRYTAATMLADAGCDTRDIMAVTGHKTEAMVSKYAQKADQSRRAEVAISKLEGRLKK